ncbi:MAG TPA: peptide chain release factor N(5)-glutamine methyltransferase [Steroidobacteraceae bacterium]|jgi:release factor glutamine methyltransferase|nr:peptide chain release factor N(5)-glutamine methyltransferase [Steroidobacteraceae bacterium]
MSARTPRSEKPETVGALLESAVRQLSATSPSARLDAELLLTHVLQRPRSFAHSHAGESVAPATVAEVLALIERRRRGEPVAYIVGRREFWSLDFEVTPDVLIPRPESELLVEFALEVLPHEAHARVLDLGTGSGALALAIARERPHARVTATDASTPALTLACRNAERLEIGNVTFLAGNWYEPVGAMHCDLIVSNPPYVAANDPALSSGDVSREPRAALTPGPTGLEAIERILARAREHLRAGGWLALEHGAVQGEAVRALFSSHGFSTIRTRQDLAGHERMTAGHA